MSTITIAPATQDHKSSIALRSATNRKRAPRFAGLGVPWPSRASLFPCLLVLLLGTAAGVQCLVVGRKKRLGVADSAPRDSESFRGSLFSDGSWLDKICRELRTAVGISRARGATIFMKIFPSARWCTCTFGRQQ